MTKIWIATSMVALLALPSVASAKGRFEAVTEADEDKAGYGAEHEVDFRNLAGEATAEGIHLTIELWNAWESLRNADDTDVTVQLMRKNSKKFTEEVAILPDGRWELRPAGKDDGGKDDDEDDGGPKPEREAPTATGTVTIDGATLDLTIPWSDLGYEAAWLKVTCARESDDESRKVYTTFRDEIPNGAEVLEVVKP